MCQSHGSVSVRSNGSLVFLDVPDNVSNDMCVYIHQCSTVIFVQFARRSKCLQGSNKQMNYYACRSRKDVKVSTKPTTHNRRYRSHKENRPCPRSFPHLEATPTITTRPTGPSRDEHRPYNVDVVLTQFHRVRVLIVSF